MAQGASMYPAGQTGVRDETTKSIDLQLGASGAISSVIESNGILTAARTAAGEYTCTLDAVGLKNIKRLSCTIQSGAPVGGKSYDFYISSALSAGVFKVQALTGAGVAGDVPDNAILNITVTGRGYPA